MVLLYHALTHKGLLLQKKSLGLQVDMCKIILTYIHACLSCSPQCMSYHLRHRFYFPHTGFIPITVSPELLLTGSSSSLPLLPLPVYLWCSWVLWSFSPPSLLCFSLTSLSLCLAPVHSPTLPPFFHYLSLFPALTCVLPF